MICKKRTDKFGSKRHCTHFSCIELFPDRLKSQMFGKAIHFYVWEQGRMFKCLFGTCIIDALFTDLSFFLCAVPERMNQCLLSYWISAESMEVQSFLYCICTRKGFLLSQKYILYFMWGSWKSQIVGANVCGMATVHREVKKKKNRKLQSSPWIRMFPMILCTYEFSHRE